MASLQRNWLVGLDWDETLTIADTMSCLKDICKVRDERLSRQESTSQPPFPTGAEVDALWDQIVKDYQEDRAVHKAEHFPTTSDATAFHEWLDSLAPVEQRSIDRVTASRIFAGVRSEDVSEAAKRAIRSGKVELRDGWIPLFQCVKDTHLAQTSLEIFSVNWSKTFIRGCLLEAANRAGLPPTERDSLLAFIRGDLYHFTIHANELDGLDQPNGSNGSISGGMHTSKDKSHRYSLAGNQVFNQDWLYVGDSTTDLGCLQHVHTGVWLRNVDEATYRQDFLSAFEPLTIPIEPLADHFDREPGDLPLVWSPDLQTLTRYLSSVRPEEDYWSEHDT